MDGSLTLKHFGVDTFSGILPFALLGCTSGRYSIISIRYVSDTPDPEAEVLTMYGLLIKSRARMRVVVVLTACSCTPSLMLVSFYGEWFKRRSFRFCVYVPVS